jgi:hypothetical protein
VIVSSNFMSTFRGFSYSSKNSSGLKTRLFWLSFNAGASFENNAQVPTGLESGLNLTNFSFTQFCHSEPFLFSTRSSSPCKNYGSQAGQGPTRGPRGHGSQTDHLRSSGRSWPVLDRSSNYQNKCIKVQRNSMDFGGWSPDRLLHAGLNTGLMCNKELQYTSPRWSDLDRPSRTEVSDFFEF